jgi:D-3-phosphoglycerate dehydrogenase
MKVLIATHPFGSTGREPLDLLEATGWELVANPHGRRLRAGEVSDCLCGIDAVIAGTEPYNAETLASAEQLRVISRVGVGLDSVDLGYCRERGIQVTYTPEAPADGVAELTVANILNLLRHIHASDRSVRERAWNRLMGKLVREVTIGIVGAGRIGSRVIRLLEPFEARILVTDTNPEAVIVEHPNVARVEPEELLQESDIVSLHIPHNRSNHHFMNRERLGKMKTGAMLINTSRGPVVDESALTDALLQQHLGGAALDVFENEPYEGPMARLDNVVLTAHIGASAQASRYRMELGAAEDCIRVLHDQKPEHDAITDELIAEGG